MIILRPAKSTDVELLQELDAQCFPTDYSYSFSVKEFWWIAYDKNVPVGFAGFKFYKKRCSFLRAGVLPEYRGKGIHKKFILTRILAAQKMGAEEIVTYTSLSNYRSFNNLVRLGFNLYRWKKELGGKKRKEYIFLWFKLKLPKN